LPEQVAAFAAVLEQPFALERHALPAQRARQRELELVAVEERERLKKGPVTSSVDVLFLELR